MTDTAERRRKRLLFRSVRRGTKESDLILGGFTHAYLDRLSAAQMDRLEALLEESDPDLLAWIGGLEAPPAAFDHDVLALLKDFKKTLSEH